MKIAMLQLNFTVGDIPGNAQKIIEGYKRACEKGAELVVISELALFGYPPKDMLERQEYLDLQDEWLDKIKKEVGDTGLIIGVARRNKGSGKPLFNSAVLLENGTKIDHWDKVLLPTYDVFDEPRYFQPAPRHNRPYGLTYKGKKLFVLICEDIWNGTEDEGHHKLYDRDPVAEIADWDPEILVVINGSPYYWGKGQVRHKLVSGIAKNLGCPVIYVNQVGGNDELVFDGRSMAFDNRGNCTALCGSFMEDLVVVDTEVRKETYGVFDSQPQDLYAAIVMAVRDYTRKSGFERVVIGLSGGIDSALTACLAVDALGRRNVVGVSMPSKYSSDGSKDDARELAENLGIEFHTVYIGDVYESYGRALKDTIGWYEAGSIKGDVTEENMQARIRGAILMAFTNRIGPKRTLLLTTGNKSEAAVGFCTLYGDTAGGYAPLVDVFKTQVYALARYRNELAVRASRGRVLIPHSTIEKEPSAELRFGQTDQDTLPPYPILDPILLKYIEEQKTLSEMILSGLEEKTIRWVLARLDGAEYKRRQYPPGAKVTTKAFGSGRRWPLAAKHI